jgi:hypothetical protein
MAFAMYNLSPTTGSRYFRQSVNAKKFLVSSFKYTISRNLIVGNSGGTFKEWGYQEVPLVLFLYGSLTPYLGVAPLKNGNIAGIKWYSNAFSFTVSGA